MLLDGNYSRLFLCFRQVQSPARPLGLFHHDADYLRIVAHALIVGEAEGGIRRTPGRLQRATQLRPVQEESLSEGMGMKEAVLLLRLGQGAVGTYKGNKNLQRIPSCSHECRQRLGHLRGHLPYLFQFFESERSCRKEYDAVVAFRLQRRTVFTPCTIQGWHHHVQAVEIFILGELPTFRMRTAHTGSPLRHIMKTVLRLHAFHQFSHLKNMYHPSAGTTVITV